ASPTSRPALPAAAPTSPPTRRALAPRGSPSTTVTSSSSSRRTPRARTPSSSWHSDAGPEADVLPSERHRAVQGGRPHEEVPVDGAGPDPPGAPGRARGADPAQRVVRGRAPRRPRLRGGDAWDRRDPHRGRGVEPRNRRSPDGRLGRGPRRLRLAEGAHAAAGRRLLCARGEGVGEGEDLDAAEVLLRPRRGAEGRRKERGTLH